MHFNYKSYKGIFKKKNVAHTLKEATTLQQHPIIILKKNQNKTNNTVSADVNVPIF